MAADAAGSLSYGADFRAVLSPKGSGGARRAEGGRAWSIRKERGVKKKKEKKSIQEILDMFAFTGRQLFEYILQGFFFFFFFGCLFRSGFSD